MYSKAIVMEPDEFEAWLQKEADATPVGIASGDKLFAMKGCAGCHSIDGSQLVGPTFKGLGAAKALADGAKVTVDENYVRESIVALAAKVVAGYSADHAVLPGPALGRRGRQPYRLHQDLSE